MLISAGDFRLFSWSHLGAMGLTIVFAVLAPKLYKHLATDSLRRSFAIWFAAGLIVNDLAHSIVLLVVDGSAKFLAEGLPFHFCGLSTYCTALTLITRHQVLYELGYYFGLAGAGLTIITPALQVDFPTYEYIWFFLGHGGIVVAVCLATFGMGLRPTFWGLWRSWLIAVVLTCGVAVVNLLINANYMFLRTAPETASPLFFLGWPWYIPFIALVAVVLFLFLWLPFGLAAGKKSALNMDGD